MASSITANTAWERGRSWRVPVRDLPWRRLPWVLPVAVAFWVLALWAFGRFINSPAAPPEPTPMEARIIELPPDPPPAPPPAPTPPPAVKPLPAPPVMPKAPPPPQPRLAQEPPTPTPPAPVNPQPAPPPEPAPPPPPPAAPSTNPAQGRAGAYAIVQPQPEVPADLAEDAARYSTSIRFQVAADGSVKVELVPPTPNPRLNRLYLDVYKTWKFYPATENGQPVASTVTGHTAVQAAK